MTKVLFVAMHRLNRSPSQRFRFEQYLSILKNEGIEFELSYLIREEDDRFLYSKGNYLKKLQIFLRSIVRRVSEVFNASKFDYIFVQREAFMTGTTIFERWFAKRSKLIFDFDDSLWLSDDSTANKKLMWLKNPDKTSKIIKASALVVAGNQYLHDYAAKFNSNTTIIPTTIDTALYIPGNKRQKEIVIGWSGSFSTIKHFEESVEALEAIKKKYGNKISIQAIGDENYMNEKLRITGQPWKLETEIEDLNNFDIGIMPLPDESWSRGKCGLKGLQYMALEIPTIMSPVGVNTEIIQDGENGFLASTTEEWVEKLSLLIEDPELRERLGKAGRKTVEERYSVEANKHLYLKLFQD